MKRLAGALVLSLAVTSLAVAGTAGRLIGTVRDEAGQPLPGATVTISSPTEIGGANMEVTGANGEFRFPSLSPGYFTVKIELLGFVPQERNEVHVRLDRATELNVTMPLGRFAEEVTVAAETPMVDPTQVSTSQNFTPEFLKGVAVTSDRRDYLTVVGMAGGVDGTRVLGATVGENAYLIDGLNTTDPLDSTWGTEIAFDAIQEISFQTGGFEAEYGNAIGGVVNVVTKSGGNAFSGSVDTRYYSTAFFQNGEHFDRNADPVKFLHPAVTLGGPILRDRLWFFAAYEYTDSRSTPDLSPTTAKEKASTYLGKLTWQAAPSWRLTGKYNADPFKFDNAGASQFTAPEATDFVTYGGYLYSADASGVPGADLLWNIGVGINREYVDSRPQSGDFTTPGHYNFVSGLSYGNSIGAYYSKRDRDEYKTNLTWFAGNLAGSHELKAGIEHDNLTYWTHNFVHSGGFFYYDVTSDYSYSDGNQSPIPFTMWEQLDPGGTTSTGKQNTLYLQDAWKVRPNLTIKLGARYDEVAYRNDAGAEIADLRKLQPRLGVAWDITGDAKNLVKASWGRFMHPSSTALPDYAHVHLATFSRWRSCSTRQGFTSPEQCQAYAAKLGWPWVAGPDSWDPNGWYQDPSADVFASEPGRIAPGLRPGYGDEVTIGFEREIARKTSIELSYVGRVTRSLFEDTCKGNLEGLTIDDPGYCPYYVVANLDGLRRDYHGAVLKLETRATDWMWLVASYTWSKSMGNLNYSLGANSEFDFCPEQCVNTYGYRYDDRRHRVKLNGYFNLPAHLRLGIDSYWESAFSYSRTQTPPNAGYCQELL